MKNKFILLCMLITLVCFGATTVMMFNDNSIDFEPSFIGEPLFFDEKPINETIDQFINTTNIYTHEERG